MDKEKSNTSSVAKATPSPQGEGIGGAPGSSPPTYVTQELLNRLGKAPLELILGGQEQSANVKYILSTPEAALIQKVLTAIINEMATCDSECVTCYEVIFGDDEPAVNNVRLMCSILEGLDEAYGEIIE